MATGINHLTNSGQLTMQEEQKHNIKRLLDSDLQNAALAYNLSVAVDLKDWFLGWFLCLPKIKAVLDLLNHYGYDDQVLIFELLGVKTDHERLQFKTTSERVQASFPELMVFDLSELAIKLDKIKEQMLHIVVLSGPSNDLETEIKSRLFDFFDMILKAKKLKRFDAGGVMSDHIDFIGQNAPTGELVITKNILKVQKRLNHARR